MNFHSLADHIPQHVWMADVNGDAFWFNRQWYDFTGLTEGEMDGRPWMAMLHADQTEAITRGYRANVRSGEPWHDNFMLRRHDGEWCWFLGRAVPVRNRQGKITRWFGTNTDITEQKQSEERHKRLMREIDHRAKNALAVAQAVVTLTDAASIQDYRRLVEGRIAALSRAHMLLADHRWQGIELRSIINAELGARTTSFGQVHLSGEAVEVKPSSGQSLALLFNELVANAERHGALNNEDGELYIDWGRAGDGSLEIKWRESGVQNLFLPERKGFGLSILQRIIRQQLGGSFESNWESDGVQHKIVLPAGGPTLG